MRGDGEIETALVGWGYRDWHLSRVKGDASQRRYFRLKQGDQSSILMDAREVPAAQTAQFVRIGQYLAAHGFKTPQIIASDLRAGLLLLEDFGTLSMARAVVDHPEIEIELYRLALSIIQKLMALPTPNFLVPVSARVLMDMLEPFFAHYLCDTDHIREAKERALGELLAFCDALCKGPKTVSLRDFHAENLMVLEHGEQGLSLGLLDFQDAFICHPAYDVVSLLQDARRDLDIEHSELLLNEFIASSGFDEREFRSSFAALGLQRNLRILGIFRKLAKQKGKRRYLQYEDRVKSYVRRNAKLLDLPYLAEDISILLDHDQPLSE